MLVLHVVPAVEQFPAARHSTHVCAAVSQYGAPKPVGQLESWVHGTHVCVVVSHAGRPVPAQFGSPRHCTQARDVVSQYGNGALQSPLVAQALPLVPPVEPPAPVVPPVPLAPAAEPPVPL